MDENIFIQRDRMRYTKNTLSSRLALLGIVFNVLFFISIYKVNDKAYYTYWIGISILYNLVFMLAAFLASEGSKNYRPMYSLLLGVLGIGQIVRIFILPPMMRDKLVEDSVKAAEGILVMPDDQYVRILIYLSASAVCLLASAVVNLIRSRQLAAHEASLKQA